MYLKESESQPPRDGELAAETEVSGQDDGGMAQNAMLVLCQGNEAGHDARFGRLAARSNKSRAKILQIPPGDSQYTTCISLCISGASR